MGRVGVLHLRLPALKTSFLPSILEHLPARATPVSHAALRALLADHFHPPLPPLPPAFRPLHLLLRLHHLIVVVSGHRLGLGREVVAVGVRGVAAAVGGESVVVKTRIGDNPKTLPIDILKRIKENLGSHLPGVVIEEHFLGAII
jgi:hypothetical protein